MKPLSHGMALYFDSNHLYLNTITVDTPLVIHYHYQSNEWGYSCNCSIHEDDQTMGPKICF